LAEVGQVEPFLAGYFSVKELENEIADAQKNPYQDKNYHHSTKLAYFFESFLVFLNATFSSSLKNLVHVHLTECHCTNSLRNPT
jgi:hypothetical protein